MLKSYLYIAFILTDIEILVKFLLLKQNVRYCWRLLIEFKPVITELDRIRNKSGREMFRTSPTERSMCENEEFRRAVSM